MKFNCYDDFKYYCINNTYKFNNILPLINLFNDNEAVFVYFDTSSHIEFILKHYILTLGCKWSHTVLCGKNNYSFIKSICDKISKNIKIINTNYENATLLSKSDFINSKEFWDQFVGETLLFYNENYLLGDENIYDYFQYKFSSSNSYILIDNTFNFGDFALFDKRSVIENINNKPINNRFISHKQNDIHNYLGIFEPWLCKNVIINFKNNYDSSNLFFNPTHYKILNIDLIKMNKHDLLIHFKNHGYYEKRKSFISDLNTQKIITENFITDYDFISSHYLELNSDLHNLSHFELIKHYCVHGINENRSTHINDTTINPSHYRLLNPDLNNMDLKKLIDHHNNYGKYENRLTHIPNFDDLNPIIGNCVIFINHCSELSGAPIFLYDFVLYLQENNMFENILLVDVTYNQKVVEKYYNKLKIKPVFYFQNYCLLRELLNYYNPIFIYSNSANVLNVYPDKFPNKDIIKTIIHYHESIEHVLNINDTILKDNKIFVVAENIQNDYKSKYNLLNLKIFPPFLSKEKLIEIDNSIINNRNGSLNSIFSNNRITFGMCGTPEYRKGYDIFIKIAINMPEHDFVWIGGEYDSTNLLSNFKQICNSKNPFKFITKLDYLLVTSRIDPCPYVILEALYLNVPCIVLDNNIKYNHTLNNNYFTIKNHNNDYKNIVKYLRENILLTKNKFYDSKQYILRNFSSPRIFTNKIRKNNIVLIAALRIEREEDYAFYKNLLNYVKIVNNMRIDIVLIIMTDHIYNGNLSFIDYNTHSLFGITKTEFDINKYDKQLGLPHDKIIFCPNKGYDVGPLLIGLKYCEKMNYAYVMHIHSKNNKIWRHELLKICNYDIKIMNCDTIICNAFLGTYSSEDYNSKIINYYNKLFPTNKIKEWQYNAGKMFSTRFSYLTPLINNFNKIYDMLTDINKNDIFWQKMMLNNEYFQKQYDYYKTNILNIPISDNAQEVFIKTKSKNFFELSSHGVKGLPDCQIEHAIERYIGLLTIYNKNVVKV
jgi:hypothetical protein